ncbi:MAG: hypothetical protein PSV13_03950 [Lacunisphaera sp.]|nr:hypothetical protein [Lacunisphaera sp.]
MKNKKPIEPRHRRVLAPIIRKMVEENRAEDARMKALILAIPPEERAAFTRSWLQNIEAREEAEFLKEVLGLKAE